MKINCVTKFIPFGIDPDYDKFQLFARKSWDAAFDSVVLFNEFEPLMAGPSISFTGDTENFVKIKSMIERAAEMPDVCVWINGDIYTSEKFHSTIEELVNRGFISGTTCRHNYDKRTMDLNAAELNFGGFDLFYGTPEVWKRMLLEIPDVFRIGLTQFDGWMLQFLQINYGPRNQFCNFYKRRVMFHPLGTSVAPRPSKYFDDMTKWIQANPDNRYMKGGGSVVIVE